MKTLVILITALLWTWSLITGPGSYAEADSKLCHTGSEAEPCYNKDIVFEPQECTTKMEMSQIECDKPPCQRDTTVTFSCHSNNTNVQIQANACHFMNNSRRENCSEKLVTVSVTVLRSVHNVKMTEYAQSATWTKPIQTTLSPTRVTPTMVTQLQAITGLGASMGLLMVVIVGMAVGWIWTCWVMMNRGRVIRSLQQATDRNNIDCTSNISYDRDNHISSHQEVPLPVYETIVPVYQMESTFKLAIAKECNCDITCGAMSGTSQMDDDKQANNVTLSLMQSNSKMETHEEYQTNLLTNGDSDCTEKDQGYHQHECNHDISTKHADTARLAKEEGLDEHRNGGTESLKANKATNSSKEIKDETTSPEHDYFQLEDFGEKEEDKERKVPWKTKIPRAYEAYVPSK